MKIAMPSPRGTNRAGLYLPAGMALDAAPERPPITAAVLWLMNRGFSNAECDAFIAKCFEQPAEDDGNPDPDLFNEHSAAFKAAGREAVSKDGRRARDELPCYGRGRGDLPRNRIDANEHAMDRHPLLGITMPKVGYP